MLKGRRREKCRSKQEEAGWDPGQPEREGKGVGTAGHGAGLAALGKGALGRRGEGRPHTRHCLDAAIDTAWNTQARAVAQLKGS